MAKQGRDYKKGIEKACQSYMTNCLTLQPPLTQILILVDESLFESTPLDPGLVRDWAQRGFCILGNTNVAFLDDNFLFHSDPYTLHNHTSLASGPGLCLAPPQI